MSFIRDTRNLEPSTLCTHSLSLCCYASYLRKRQKEDPGNDRSKCLILCLVRWWNKQCWKSFLGMWRTRNAILAESFQAPQPTPTPCLSWCSTSPQQLQGLGFKTRCAKKKTNNKPSNQHQTGFLLFKAGLSTKNHAEEAVFSSKHNQISVQLLTSQGTTSCLSTETAWSRSLACYKTEPCSWLMPKEQQLE